MYKTKNTLPEPVRIQVIGLLQERLADSIDLFTQAKQAHWNVKGPDFIALHKLFDEVAEESEGYADLIAERVVQLGGIAEGTLAVVSGRTSLPKYPPLIATSRDHIVALSLSLGMFSERMRNGIAKATEVQDASTADILTEISRGADKFLWFVEAHIQTDR